MQKQSVAVRSWTALGAGDAYVICGNYFLGNGAKENIVQKSQARRQLIPPVKSITNIEPMRGS